MWWRGDHGVPPGTTPDGSGRLCTDGLVADPYRYLTVAAFRAEYTRYRDRQRRVVREGQYLVVND